MRSLLPIIIPALLLGGCSRQQEAQDNRGSPAAPVVQIRPSPSPPSVDAKPAEPLWKLQPGVKGTELLLRSQTGERIISLTCLAGKNRLQINVPGFAPIGSEDRLSFGSGGHVEALVADFRGDRQSGGVSAEGAVPANLPELMGGAIAASYGAQTSGPHPVVPRTMAGAFLAACRSGASAVAPRAALPDAKASPCMVQDGDALAVKPMRAIGTEPFWAAKIEGRCVTYSHPEDQQGIRVWTRFTPTSEGGLWSGALGGQPFELRTRAAPGCSDGMSDKSYPVATDLLVHGEQRKGCAEPL